MARLVGEGRSREWPIRRQRILTDGACGAGLGTVDASQPFLLPSAGDLFSFHSREEVISATKNLVCKIT